MILCSLTNRLGSSMGQYSGRIQDQILPYLQSINDIRIIKRVAPWTMSNKTFEKASADLVGNSDDLYLLGLLCTVAESCREYLKAQLSIGNIQSIDEDDRIAWGSKFTPFSVSHLICLDWNLSTQATFIRRQRVEQVGPLREDMQVGCDWDSFIKVGKLAKHTVLHRKYGDCYRIHSTSRLSTYSYDSRRLIEVQVLRRDGIRGKEELPHRLRPWWQTRFLKLRDISYTILPYNQKQVFRRLRPLLIWCLARLGTVCTGFELEVPDP